MVGNSEYERVQRLGNPKNDAGAVGDAFERLGYSVTRLMDADYDALRQGLRSFKEAARGKEVAVVFYAGHGIAVEGSNYLVPVDAHLEYADAVQDEAIPLARVMSAVGNTRHLGLVILDACRDNPFVASMKGSTRSIKRGLARMPDEPGKTLVAYATKHGDTAEDDGGKGHSPYTEALLRYLEEPGLEVVWLFRKVSDAVIATSKRRGRSQTPWTYGQLGGTAVYLASGGRPPIEDTKTAGGGTTPPDPAKAALAERIAKLEREAREAKEADRRAQQEEEKRRAEAEARRKAEARLEREAADPWNLFVAVRDGDVARIKALVGAGANANAKDPAKKERNSRPLHWAAVLGNVGSVNALLAGGADPNATTDHGWTPLHSAAWKGKADTIRVLLARGADPDVKDKGGATALRRALIEGQAEAVDALLEGGADPSAALTPVNKTMVVTGKTSLRQLPSPTAKLAGGVENGQQIAVSAQAEGWYQVRQASGLAYLQSNFLRDLQCRTVEKVRYREKKISFLAWGDAEGPGEQTRRLCKRAALEDYEKGVDRRIRTCHRLVVQGDAKIRIVPERPRLADVDRESTGRGKHRYHECEIRGTLTCRGNMLSKEEVCD